MDEGLDALTTRPTPALTPSTGHTLSTWSEVLDDTEIVGVGAAWSDFLAAGRRKGHPKDSSPGSTGEGGLRRDLRVILGGSIYGSI